MEEILQKTASFFTEARTNAILKFVGAIVVLIIGFWLIKKALRLLEKSRLSEKMDKGLFSFLKTFASIALKIVLFLSVANYIGIPMTSVITLLGSAGLALGLSLQGSLSNLAGGIMLLLFKPFRIGDYIETAGASGTVEDISIFYTRLATVDNKRIMVPNGTLSNSSITNFSAMPQRRVELKLSAGYTSDIDKVNGILLRIAQNHPKVLDDPAPTARLSEMADSALVFTLRAWCATEDYWDVFFDLTEETKKEFDKAGIEIPFPQLDVHTRP